MASKITVAEVSANMLLNMDTNSVNKVKSTVKSTAHHLKHELGEIGEGAKESLKELTASAGGLGNVLGGALSGLTKAGPIGLIVGALAAALGGVAMQAEHMSKQFENGVQTITELKAKAEGLGVTVQKYQKLQYLAGISSVNVGDLERVMGRINITAGEIQTNGAGSSEETRILSQMLGGDGKGLAGDQKLHMVLDSLRQMVGQGRKDEALYALKVLAPRAALDPAMQAFFLGTGLKNWDKAKEFHEVLSKKDEKELSDPRNQETYFGNQIGNVTKELHRVAIHMDSFRENYKHVDEVEEGLKDKLAATAGLVEKATKGAEATLKMGEDAVKTTTYFGEKVLKGMGDLVDAMQKPDFWSSLGNTVANAVRDPNLYSKAGKKLYNEFTTNHTTSLHEN